MANPAVVIVTNKKLTATSRTAYIVRVNINPRRIKKYIAEENIHNFIKIIPDSCNKPGGNFSPLEQNKYNAIICEKEIMENIRNTFLNTNLLYPFVFKRE